ISLVGLPIAMTVVILTIVGAALDVLVLLALPAAIALGMIAFGLLVGDRLGRGSGVQLKPLPAALLGVTVLRLIRLIPVAGGVLSGLISWFCLAAVVVVAWDIGNSWYRRRMPDHEQFRGEDLIEWPPRPGNIPPDPL